MRGTIGLILVAACTLLSGCTARYILGRRDLQDALERDAFNQLGVYVTHRTLPVYKRNDSSSKRISRRIEDRSRDSELYKRINRNDVGLIVHHDHLNGAHRLYVSFKPSCREPDCAYEFVQTEDGRYRLVDLPDRSDYDEKKVYRTFEWDRHELKLGKLRSLSDANAVYRLERKRKKRPKTVFLEVKRTRKKRTDRRFEAEGGN